MAEGVESEEAWASLADLGCHEAQGYYLSRPAGPEIMTEWLRAHSDGELESRELRAAAGSVTG